MFSFASVITHQKTRPSGQRCVLKRDGLTNGRNNGWTDRLSNFLMFCETSLNKRAQSGRGRWHYASRPIVGRSDRQAQTDRRADTLRTDARTHLDSSSRLFHKLYTLFIYVVSILVVKTVVYKNGKKRWYSSFFFRGYGGGRIFWNECAWDARNQRFPPFIFRFLNNYTRA